MFTRKHFETVANNIKLATEYANDQHTMEVLEALANAFAMDFKKSNSNFDRDKFLKACGFSE